LHSIKKIDFMENFKMMRLPMVAFVALAMFFASCSPQENTVPAPVPNLQQIIAQSPNFSILNAAVNKAGLGTALASTQNITVFAPDDAAFAASGITSIDALTATQLQGILGYHVVPQRVGSAAVPVSDTVKTLTGTNIFASRNVNGVFTNGIKVKSADMLGSNGIIHTIERVLIPTNKTIVALALEDPTLSMFAAAVTKVGLVPTFTGPGKFTVFAPTNAAFIASGITDVNALPNQILEPILKGHVIGTNVFASDLVNNMTAPNLNATSLIITTTPSATVKINGSTQTAAPITATNILALNGVIHKIGRVIIP
jgi:uncharacterized surface protein with fasciclin (FAS1) repeats